MGIKKRGVFFSIDALIAISIILLVLIIAVPLTSYSRSTTEIHRDTIKSFSTLQIGEIQNTYVQTLISQGHITDPNKTILEQIGEFYVSNRTLAKAISQSILDEINITQNIGIWYQNNLLASKNKTPIETARNVEVAKQIISGIGNGGSVTGFSARAYLTSALQHKYFYFGGYIGDGNITINIDCPGNITEAEMELVINNNFDLYINSNFEGNYQKSTDEYTPIKHTLPISNLQTGDNTIELRGQLLHVAGGFIKITYEADPTYTQPKKYEFPGINGIINLYDGFYVPGNITNLNISLHLNTNHTAFLKIGNTTVFRNTTQATEKTINIQNSELSSLLSYDQISKKTIPIRMGIENISYITIYNQSVEVISVSDISGSMQGSVNSSTKMLDLSKRANKLLVSAILEFFINKAGVVGYESDIKPEDFHELSTNNNTLNTTIESWKQGGQRCVCCGILNATEEFNGSANSTTKKVMVVMSSAKATGTCSEIGTGDAEQDAVMAACRARQDHGIIVHAVSFGDDANATMLQGIALCGNGSFYHSTIDGLVEVYSQISRDIINASYKEQTVEFEGDLQSTIYPDSYIQFDYQEEITPYGLLITTEKQFDNNLSGNLTIPGNSTVIETIAVSYSGPKWTDEVKINSNPVYSITDYGSEFVLLGDPYQINIPSSLVQKNNTIDLTIGSLAGNSTPGSASNKIISTIAKEVSSYSDIAPNKEGCNWTIEFEDSENLSINIPYNYTGTDLCYYMLNNQVYDNNDAVQNAAYDLLKILDLDLNNKIDTKFTEANLQIDITELSGIPYVWSTEVQIRTWY